jgi:hypothetical protein
MVNNHLGDWRFLVYLYDIAMVILIGLKQFHYYYGGLGIKDGMFVNVVGCPNSREKSEDMALSFLGGVLISMIFAPYYFIITLCTYSVVASIRCKEPLLRGRVAKADIKLIKSDLESLTKEYHGMNPREILLGWHFSHSIIAQFLSLILILMVIFYTEYYVVALIITLSIGLIVLPLLYFGLSYWSVSLGKYLFRVYSRKGLTCL